MSLVNANTCPPSAACACSDSPLSIAGNVAGLLTFAAAIAGVIWGYVRFFQGVSGDHIEVSQILQERAEIFELLEKRLQAIEATDGVPEEYRVLAFRSLQKWREAMRTLDRFLCKNIPANDFRSRAIFSIYKEEMSILLQTLDRCLSDLRTVTSGVPNQYVLSNQHRLCLSNINNPSLSLVKSSDIMQALEIIQQETSRRVNDILILVGQVLNRVQSLEESRSYHESMTRPSQ